MSQNLNLSTYTDQKLVFWGFRCSFRCLRAIDLHTIDCLAFLFCVSVARIISVDTGNDIDWKRLIMPRKTSKSLPFVFSAVSQLKFFSNPLKLFRIRYVTHVLLQNEFIWCSLHKSAFAQSKHFWPV